MRIQKYLASVTSMSRRKVEGEIALGRVLINGAKAKLGAFVENGDKLHWNEKTYIVNITQPKLEIVCYNKPLGEVCSKFDANSRPLVFDSLPKCKEGRWVSVGRLDINSEGLLLFCNDGDLANKMMHPRANWLRVYKVRVFGQVEDKHIKRACQGITIDGDLCKFNTCQLLSEDASGKNKWYIVSVKSGKFRMVRKLWEQIGGVVNRLIRVSYGPINLDITQKPGSIKRLTEKEMKSIVESLLNV